MTNGRWKQYANILEALLGGEPAAFAALTSFGLQPQLYLQSPTLVTLQPNTLGGGGSNQQSFAWGAGWPNIPGMLFAPTACRLQVASQSGVHVANPTLQSGTNGSVNNFVNGSAIAATTINTSIGAGTTKNCFYTVSAIPSSYPPAALDGGAGPNIYIGTQATAGTVLTGYVWVLGFLVPEL